VKHVVLTRSAYGPGWTPEANARRLAMTRAITIPSLAAQTAKFSWIVLLHRKDDLLDERRATYKAAGAKFIYTDTSGDPADVAFVAYGADWAKAVGSRSMAVAMTRLDDDDAFAPWALAAIQEEALKRTRRTVLILPVGIRAWSGGYTTVVHQSNAWQTLVTPPGDTMTVYDYGHRFAARTMRKAGGTVKFIVDRRPAWLWSRHPDAISGWRVADKPLTDEIRALFPIDWRPLEGQHRPPSRRERPGRVFR
jgi:hypothetical protein